MSEVSVLQIFPVFMSTHFGAGGGDVFSLFLSQ